MSEVEKLLNLKSNVKKAHKTSFHLDKDVYEHFHKYCTEKNLSPSKVLNALIIDFNDKQEKK